MSLPSDRYSGGPPSSGYDEDAHFARLMDVWSAQPFRDPEHCNRHNDDLLLGILKPHGMPSKQFVQAIGDLTYGLYEHEGLYELPPPLKLRHDLEEKEVLYATHGERLAAADSVIREFFGRFFKRVRPEIAFSEPKDPTVALIELASSPEDLVADFMDSFHEPDIFPKTAEMLRRNLCRVSGLNFDNLPERPKFKYPQDVDLSPTDLNDAYLRRTPLARILNIAVPFHVPERTRFEHTHVLGGTGHGKTTLLTQRFIEDVFDPRQPAIIVIDGKGTWAPALQRLKIFGPAREQSKRLIFINPKDPQPPALNMFSLPNVPGGIRASMIDSVTENLAYIFGSRDFELSAKQRTAFTYCAQLLFALDETPTIETLLDLMQDQPEKTGGIRQTSRFKPALEKQERLFRRFFDDLFYHPTEYGETRRQIQNRIHDLLSSPAFARMLTRQENTLDMFDVMQSGKILIVDASPGAVGEKAASAFGRYFIASALSAARARVEVPQSTWRPCWLYVDEAQLFVDEERTQPLLQQARGFNLGVILAHQKLMDLSPQVRATFASNTSIKYCGTRSADDARDMAKEMRCDASFILSQPRGSFATYIGGYTPRALSTSYPGGIIENIDTMSDAEYAQLVARNRATMSPRQSTYRGRPAPSARQPVPSPRPKPDDTPPDAASSTY
ncbi:type IV secretory system conjugative DNA transfer family protein [Bradyrhizobium sp. ORS 285]|uniref:type IV secretory system conjugative DNA transfer family protein n=1 Tax=Bradyrhizobium sp. ORS 285 TaxID=115808 RepID=UPI000555A723|nr:hypothetical protein [Bradyrhizobium sp. ORS 285]